MPMQPRPRGDTSMLWFPEPSRRVFNFCGITFSLSSSLAAAPHTGVANKAVPNIAPAFTKFLRFSMGILLIPFTNFGNGSQGIRIQITAFTTNITDRVVEPVIFLFLSISRKSPGSPKAALPEQRYASKAFVYQEGYRPDKTYYPDI